MPIFLYKESSSVCVDTDTVLSFLKDYSLHIEYSDDLLSFLKPGEHSSGELENTINKSRVLNIEKPIDYPDGSFQTEESYQEKREIYDGHWIQRKLYKQLSARNDRFNSIDLNIILTDRLLATFGGRRYHARVVIMGNPSIISTSGLIEGPARPREYYFMKASYIQSGKDTNEIDNYFKDRYLVYNDSKISKTVSSYCLQPILYHYTGQEFCIDSACSLYNSHWQEEVMKIHANNVVCDRCKNKLEQLSSRI